MDKHILQNISKQKRNDNFLLNMAGVYLSSRKSHQKQLVILSRGRKCSGALTYVFCLHEIIDVRFTFMAERILLWLTYSGVYLCTLL